MIDLFYFQILAALVFIIGLVGVLINRHNLIVVLMSIELILLSVNINFVAFSYALNDLTGQIFPLFNLAIAAAEAAIGLAIIILYYRSKRSLRVDDLSELKG